MLSVAINGIPYTALKGERLVDVVNRSGNRLAQVCYQPQLGPIQTCDTCMVEINGELGRACATTVFEGMEVSTVSETSPHGTVRVQALVTERVKGKELFLPMNSLESMVNRLTGSHTDTVTHTRRTKKHG